MQVHGEIFAKSNYWIFLKHLQYIQSLDTNKFWTTSIKEASKHTKVWKRKMKKLISALFDVNWLQKVRLQYIKHTKTCYLCDST
jgi:hypothetical protein